MLIVKDADVCIEYLKDSSTPLCAADTNQGGASKLWAWALRFKFGMVRVRRLVFLSSDYKVTGLRSRYFLDLREQFAKLALKII
jgi:hypothetical protein